MDLIDEIERFRPRCEQEAADRLLMLDFMRTHDDFLLRDNQIAHVTTSAWTVNERRTKVLMVYHRIYDSWSWVGGHADGDADLRRVALRELREETGVSEARLADETILSLEVLTVSGHVRRGSYVPSHLHLNVTFLLEADERSPLAHNADENLDVRWFSFTEALAASTEPWMVDHVYRKLVERSH